ncbi:hypothetical protein ACFY8B_32940 [Streptomyces sp. NPDC012751]|uniref:hypothetical protein n=1 Tax=Streptomyces sp. NPDC012751 TaxID=3364846 RepID=UPI0036B73D97
MRTALSATARTSSDASGRNRLPGSLKAHVHRSAAARTASPSSAGAAGAGAGAWCGAGEAGCWRWAPSMALEAARPRPVAAVVSAIRSRWLAMSRAPADHPSSKRCSDLCGALLSEIQVWASGARRTLGDGDR